MQGLALSQAVWARMCAGTREDGTLIEANDPIWDSLKAAGTAAKSDPQLWLSQRDLYGDLADDVMFQTCFKDWLNLIWADGLEAALRTYIQG